MQTLDKLFIIIIILITTLFINSCSTSSYSERYGSSESYKNSPSQEDSNRNFGR